MLERNTGEKYRREIQERNTGEKYRREMSWKKCHERNVRRELSERNVMGEMS